MSAGSNTAWHSAPSASRAVLPACSGPVGLSAAGKLVAQAPPSSASQLRRGCDDAPHGAHRTGTFQRIRLSSRRVQARSAVRISRPLLAHVPVHLPPFAMRTAFPSSDYYGGSVARSLAGGGRSPVPASPDVQARRRWPVRPLERPHWSSPTGRREASSGLFSADRSGGPAQTWSAGGVALHRWRLGFRQSSVHHSARVLPDGGRHVFGHLPRRGRRLVRATCLGQVADACAHVAIRARSTEVHGRRTADHGLVVVFNSLILTVRRNYGRWRSTSRTTPPSSSWVGDPALRGEPAARTGRLATPRADSMCAHVGG
jgi:hypothetical protein